MDVAHHRRAKLLLILAGVIPFFFMVYAGQPWKSYVPLVEWLGGTLIFWLFNWLPYGFVYLCVTNCFHRISKRVSISIFVLLLVLSTLALIDTFFIASPDAQNALIFVALPLILWPGCLIAGMVCLAVEAWAKKRALP
jgi:hypothetical protein